MTKRALVTGVCGQDGSYLAELLLSKGYEVFGLVRRTTTPPRVVPGVRIIWGDMTDQGSLNRAVIEAVPDEVYNLAAQSFVGVSWNVPVATADINGLGTLRLLEALRLYNPKARFYQASTSEMFGDQGGLLDETSSFTPRSPYGFSKVFAHHATVNYRESYGMFTSCGVLFNHESPRRGSEFVTKKIVNQMKKICRNEQTKLYLGDVSARRDWGYAKEYVEAMWLLLQLSAPIDTVIATGETHSVLDFVGYCAEAAGISMPEIETDPTMIRPAEIKDLRGNATKAHNELGWRPTVKVPELARIMMEAD